MMFLVMLAVLLRWGPDAAAKPSATLFNKLEVVVSLFVSLSDLRGGGKEVEEEKLGTWSSSVQVGGWSAFLLSFDCLRGGGASRDGRAASSFRQVRRSIPVVICSGP
jgi:hypothetical protein